MPKIYHALGPGSRLAELLGADDSIRSQIPGDVHLVSLDGTTFYQFSRRPEAEDYDRLRDLIANDSSERPLEFGRGIVQRATGNIEEIEFGS
jgi:hypothetical protein